MAKVQHLACKGGQVKRKRLIDPQAEKQQQKYVWAEKKIVKKTKQKNIDMGRQSDGQTDRRIDTQTDHETNGTDIYKLPPT